MDRHASLDIFITLCSKGGIVYLFSVVSVYMSVNTINSWTIRDIITKFAGHHPMVERADKFNQTVNDRVAHSKVPKKCAYHVTFDLDLDLENTLDAGLPGDHRLEVWSRSSHLPARRSDFRASTKVPVSRDHWPRPWAHPGCTLTWSPSCASLMAIRPFACEKKRFAQKFAVRDGQTTDAAPLH